MCKASGLKFQVSGLKYRIPRFQVPGLAAEGSGQAVFKPDRRRFGEGVSRFSRRRMGRLAAFFFIALLNLAVVRVNGEAPWHDFALRLYSGFIENGGTIDSRDGYGTLDMGSAAIYGIGCEMDIQNDYALELAVYKFSSTATQRGEPSSAYGGDYIDINLEVTTLSLTGKRRFSKMEGLLIPWFGGGIDANFVSMDEQENIQTSGGILPQDKTKKVSNGFGAHGSAGLDFYPHKSSALALMLEGRYTFFSVSGPFKGDLNGLSVFLGLKWDFGPKIY